MADLQTQNALIEAHALARHVRMSPQKARLVMDLIRGQKAQDALHTLKYTPKRAAKHIEKVLRSAIANAERKAEDSGAPLDVDMLFVAQCFVNEGPRWKRLHRAPCSQGLDREASGLEKGQEVRRVMGQKTHPYGFRLGYNKPWKSRWYADKDYADLLHEDVKLRKELKEKLKSAGISSIDIERAANKLVVRI